MRAYFFGNMYLSSIQQGIQAAHVVSDMFVEYKEKIQCHMLFDWAEAHKTMILLNAGYADEILNLAEFFDSRANPYPYAMFREEQASLNNAPTSIGIILPKQIYEGAAQIRKSRTDAVEQKMMRENVVDWMEDDIKYTLPVSDYEIELMLRINEYGMAS